MTFNRPFRKDLRSGRREQTPTKNASIGAEAQRGRAAPV